VIQIVRGDDLVQHIKPASIPDLFEVALDKLARRFDVHAFSAIVPAADAAAAKRIVPSLGTAVINPG
jgi:hypothetical protein